MSMSVESIKLEAMNAASLEYTHKIERERSRNHTLLEKSLKLKQLIQERRQELLTSRKSKTNVKPPSKPQLEGRLAFLRTKFGTQSSENIKLRDLIDNLRLERNHGKLLNYKTSKALERAKVKCAELKQDLLETNQHLKDVSNRLESLKIATLDEIEADQAEIDSLSYQVFPGKCLLATTKRSTSDTLSIASPMSTTSDNLRSGGISPISAHVHENLRISQAVVTKRADDLEQLYQDREAVIKAMVTIHALRDECGISDDSELIEAFEAHEELNYNQCQEINRMLGDLAVIEQEKIILDGMALDEGSTAQLDDTSVDTHDRSLHQIKAATREYETRARRDEGAVESCTRLVINLLLTLTSKTKTKTDDTLGLAGKPLTEMLALIENTIDTYAHLSDTGPLKLTSAPCRGCLPSIKDSKHADGLTNAPHPSPTRSFRRQTATSGGQAQSTQRTSSTVSIQQGNGPRPPALPSTDIDDDNDEDASAPQSLEDLRLRTRLKLEATSLSTATALLVGARRFSRFNVLK